MFLVLTGIVPAAAQAGRGQIPPGFNPDGIARGMTIQRPVRNDKIDNSGRNQEYYEPSDSSIGSLLATLNKEGNIYYVSQKKGDNKNDGLSRTTAFKTLQKAVNAAKDNDTILVWPGVYSEPVYILNKAITIQSVDYPAVIENNYDDAIVFYCSEGKEASLKNFLIRNSTIGIHVYAGSPVLSNLTIVDCNAAIMAEDTAEPRINSCILSNNNDNLVNCTARYSYVQEKSVRD